MSMTEGPEGEARDIQYTVLMGRHRMSPASVRIERAQLVQRSHGR